MSALQSFRLNANGIELHVNVLGRATAPTLIMLHGLRDVSQSLLEVAEPLAQRYRVVLPDLRGHGESQRANAYAWEHYLLDLYHLVQHLGGEPVCLVGHSLGGQIVARFCGLFPELTRCAVLVEGLGPPELAESKDAARQVASYRERLLSRVDAPAQTRALPSIAFAAERLRRNNPRLSAERAQFIARFATKLDAAGELRWAFDPRAGSVFVNAGDGELFWQQSRCPVLVISGDLAYEYWRTQFGERLSGDGRYAPGEMDARAALFGTQAKHIPFDGSGHMVHYDEPERLGRETLAFLEDNA